MSEFFDSLKFEDYFIEKHENWTKVDPALRKKNILKKFN